MSDRRRARGPGGRTVTIILSVAIAAVGCGPNGASSGTPSGGAPSQTASSPSAGSSGSPASASPSASASSGPTPAPGSASPATAASPSISPDTFTNPVVDRNFADPFILRDGDGYVAFATGDLTVNIQVITSPDLVEWTSRREALPTLPFWQPSAKGLTWAPEVAHTSAGYVMYYTGRDVQAGKQCLAVAVAETAEGPFVDESDEPFLCQPDLGGSIDSSPFLDTDGKRYLLWKNDGNCCGIPTKLYIQRLSEDGLKLQGKPRDLGLEVDHAWERTLIEAPTLWHRGGTYYLLFSANAYDSKDYAVGYATSDTVLGPYVDAKENPIVASAGSAAGPGHQSIVEDDDGDLWLAYHAWDAALVGDRLGGRRALWLDELILEDGTARLDGPDDGPQPRP